MEKVSLHHYANRAEGAFRLILILISADGNVKWLIPCNDCSITVEKPEKQPRTCRQGILMPKNQIRNGQPMAPVPCLSRSRVCPSRIYITEKSSAMQLANESILNRLQSQQVGMCQSMLILSIPVSSGMIILI